MYKDVSIGQLREPPMLTVGVGEVKDINWVGRHFFLDSYNGLYIDSFSQLKKKQRYTPSTCLFFSHPFVRQHTFVERLFRAYFAIYQDVI